MNVAQAGRVSLLPTIFFEHGAKVPVNRFGYEARPFAVWVNTVRQIESFNSRNAFEEKRYELNIMFSRESRERIVDFALVFGSRIRRRFHSRKQHLSAARLRAFYDPAEVLSHFAHGLPAQYIVSPKLNDDDPDISFHRPVYAAKPARRNVARNSRVHDLVVKTVGFESFLQQRRIALGGR